MFGDAEKGANAARQRTAEGGSAMERQKLERAEQKRRAPGLQTMGEPGRASHRRPHRRRRRSGTRADGPALDHDRLGERPRCEQTADQFGASPEASARTWRECPTSGALVTKIGVGAAPGALTVIRLFAE
jgi:hypothetical protein